MENKISAADAVLTTVPNPRTAGQRKLSGHTYVPMRLRGSDGLRTSPTLVRDESRCGHLHTICVTCHADWDTTTRCSTTARSRAGNYSPACRRSAPRADPTPQTTA